MKLGLSMSRRIEVIHTNETVLLKYWWNTDDKRRLHRGIRRASCPSGTDHGTSGPYRHIHTPPSVSLSPVVGRSHSFDRAPNKIRAFAALKRKSAGWSAAALGICAGRGWSDGDWSWRALAGSGSGEGCCSSASNWPVNETHKLLQLACFI